MIKFFFGTFLIYSMFFQIFACENDFLKEKNYQKSRQKLGNTITSYLAFENDTKEFYKNLKNKFNNILDENWQTEVEKIFRDSTKSRNDYDDYLNRKILTAIKGYELC
ncbi:MAG: hypothetical protein ACRYGR_07585 [Janthinobacterium lividum]